MALLPILVYLLLWAGLLLNQPSADQLMTGKAAKGRAAGSLAGSPAGILAGSPVGSPAGSPARLRQAALKAALLWGAWLALESEILGLLHVLTPGAAAAGWVVALLILLAVAWRRGFFPAAQKTHRSDWKAAWSRLRDDWKASWGRPDRWEAAIMAGLGLILAALAVVALYSPPNNNDSLLYHMARVAHWIQNRSLAPYATAYGHQLYNPIWAEEAILHLRLLAGSDRLVNLVQWASLVGCAAGASAIAALLGAGRRGQLAAAAFTISIPIGLLEATSTQNDLVTAFWLVCLAYLTVLNLKQNFSRPDHIYWGLALGLGLLTKGTFYPYALPFALAYGVSLLRRLPFRLAVSRVALVVFLAAGLNAGYWGRNLASFGTPLGSAGYAGGHTSLKTSLGSFTAEAIKFTAINFYTPWRPVNSKLWAGVYYALRGIGQDVGDFHLNRTWNHEDTAGAPLHILLSAGAVIALVAWRKRFSGSLTLVYAALVLGSLVCLVMVVNLDNYSARFWLPLLVCAASLVGLAVDQLVSRRLAAIFAGLLLVAALPWVLFNQTRPLIGMLPEPAPLSIPCSQVFGCTSAGSVLVEPAMVTLFANQPYLRDGMISLGADLRSSSCREVGLRIDSSDPEYLYWRVLQAPQSGIRIETLEPAAGLEFLVDISFKPCAIICSVCGADRQRLYGLDYSGSYAGIRLYTGEDFQPYPGE